jgi:hypothetical protein
MKIGASRSLRRFLSLAVVGILIPLVAACTGRGGGQLPPQSPVFSGQASFGFTFSCEDPGGINPPTGQLKIELSYTDHGSNPIGSSFSIHGIVDEIDPVTVSEFCIGRNPAPDGKLIFLGRYYLTSSAPAEFPSTCPSRETATTPLCRFEVIVQDNDRNLTPSPGDFFSIKLSNGTALTSELDPLTVFYARAGYLDSGNITVD